MLSPRAWPASSRRAESTLWDPPPPPSSTGQSIVGPSAAGTRATGRRNSFDTDSRVSGAWRAPDAATWDAAGLRRTAPQRGGGDFRFRDDTLIPLLADSMVPMEQIEAQYKIPTSCVRELIGLVPRCDSYLEIWPVAFKTYNLVVPNCFNIPFTQVRFGPGGSRQACDLQGCAMFAVSKAAECAYCTAHTCSFALRRGAAPETLDEGWRAAGGRVGADERLFGRAIEEQWGAAGGRVGEAERATFTVARCLGQVPCQLTERDRSALVRAVGVANTEVLIFSMAGMGYLNKVMDGLGVQLEQECFVETRDFVGEGINPMHSKANPMLDPSAPSSRPKKDTLWSRLRFVSRVPGAVRQEFKITKGVPNAWPAVGEHLRAAIGYDFPFLSAFRSKSFLSKRVTVALATALIDNYDPKYSVVTVPIKVLAGVIFATVAKSFILAEQFQQLATVFCIDPEVLQAARELGGLSPQGLGGDLSMLPRRLKHLDHPSQCLLLLARAIAPTPAEVTAELVETLSDARLPAECVIELVNFVALAQLQLRLCTFYPHKVVPPGWMPPSNGVRMPAAQTTPRSSAPAGASPIGGFSNASSFWNDAPQPHQAPTPPHRASQSQNIWMHMEESYPSPAPSSPRAASVYSQHPDARYYKLQAIPPPPPPRSNRRSPPASGPLAQASHSSSTDHSTLSTLRHSSPPPPATLRGDSAPPPEWVQKMQEEAEREGGYLEWVEHAPVLEATGAVGTLGWFGLRGWSDETHM